MTFKAAKCPNCAGDLQVPDDRDTVKCESCGSDIIVREAIKLAGGVNSESLLELAKNAESSNEYNEAFKYYSQILEHDAKNVEAWVGRGINNYAKGSKYELSIGCFKKALNFSSDKNKAKDAIINKVIKYPIFSTFIYELDPTNVIGLFAKAEEATSYSKRIEYYEKALLVSKNDPTHHQIIDKIIVQLCKPIQKEKLLSTQLDIAVEDFQLPLNFVHKIKPDDRTLKETIIGKLKDVIRRADEEVTSFDLFDSASLQKVLDFAHKIDPEDRQLEKAIVEMFSADTALDQKYCKLFKDYIKEIEKVDKTYFNDKRKRSNTTNSAIRWRETERRCGVSGSPTTAVVVIIIILISLIVVAIVVSKNKYKNRTENTSPSASETSKNEDSTAKRKVKAKKQNSPASVPINPIGIWDAYFLSYGKKINFELHIGQNGASIAGIIREDGSYTADIEGKIKGNSIAFTKNYKGRGFEPVEYVGTINNNKIRGKWIIKKTGVSGEWVATKKG